MNSKFDGTNIPLYCTIFYLKDDEDLNDDKKKESE